MAAKLSNMWYVTLMQSHLLTFDPLGLRCTAYPQKIFLGTLNRPTACYVGIYGGMSLFLIDCTRRLGVMRASNLSKFPMYGVRATTV